MATQNDETNGPIGITHICVWAACVWLTGCGWLWPSDGDYDQRRCVPGCSQGEVCFKGRCVAPDAGAGADQAVDGSLADQSYAEAKPDALPWDAPVPDVAVDLDVSVDLTASPDTHLDHPDVYPDTHPDTVSGPDFVPWPDQTAWPDKTSPDLKKPKCGDWVIDFGEQCDGNNLNNKSCATLGFTTGTLSCKGCKFDTSACETCGDGKITKSEQCDGKNLGGGKCSTKGMSGGHLACKSDCTLDKSNCFDQVDYSPISISGSKNSPNFHRVATNGSDFLVVWEDGSSSTTVYDIYGAVVDKSGNASSPFVISATSHYERNPDVVSDGSGYLVVWQAMTTSSYSSTNIYAARVSSSGKVLDTKGVPVSTATGAQAYPQAAFGKGEYFVVWQDARKVSKGEVYGARVSKAGKVSDPNGLPISTTGKGISMPTIGFDGTNYFAVWEDYRGGSGAPDIDGTRLDAAGTILDKNHIAVSATIVQEKAPALAFDGTNYLVAWIQHPSYALGSETFVHGARVTKAGKVLDTPSLEIEGDTYTACAGITVVNDGMGFLVVYQVEDYSSVMFPSFPDPVTGAARVLSAGKILKLELGLSGSSPYEYSTRAVTNGIGRIFFVWRGFSNGVYGARIKF